ncbi:hypothetical protein BD413DRAFT_477700, partial [Trametes elegans]
WAPDHHQRDTALKLVNTGSDEHCIYQQSLSSSQLFRIDTFSGVLPPIANLDSTLGFSFVAMPRQAPPWGSMGRLEHMRSAYEVIQFMRLTVNDIDSNNMLVNCYNPLAVILGDDNEDILPTHPRAYSVRYCLFDFNVSLRSPEDTSLSACRRPSCESSIGSPLFQPPDVNFGEYEYNPFAYDVACLGNVYRIYFSPMVPDAPLLAPLFDRMTTYIVSERFTAAEAADFLGSIAHQISDSGVDAQLASTLRGRPGYTSHSSRAQVGFHRGDVVTRYLNSHYEELVSPVVLTRRDLPDDEGILCHVKCNSTWIDQKWAVQRMQQRTCRSTGDPI